MQIIDVTAELKGISFQPRNELEEILQNVRTILTTAKYTVPMDRGFGLDTAIVDMPMNFATAKLTAEIVAALRHYEPRVSVKKVTYKADGDGKLVPTVRVAIR